MLLSKITESVDAPILASSDTEGWRLNECHLVLRETTKQYTLTQLQPVANEIRRNGRIPGKTLDGLRATGWFGLLIPVEYGGLGLDCLARLVNVQEVARVCPDVGAVLQIGQLGTGSLIEHGSHAQKAKWLPILAAGERICTISITEEASGSHVLGLQTTYEELEDGFVLNGEKCFIGNAPIAGLHVVYARSRHRPDEFSAFIVEGERPGVDNSRTHETLGLRAFPFGQVRFDNCKIPRDNLLGKLGQGKEIAYHVISCHGRPSLTALALGIHERVLELALKFSKERVLYGQPIEALPDVRNKIYEIYRLFEASKQTSYRATYLQSTGQPSFRAFAMAKQQAGDAACAAALIASEIFGARVGFAEYEIAQLLLDGLMARPPSGTGDVQRLRVLESLIDGRSPPWESGLAYREE